MNLKQRLPVGRIVLLAILILAVGLVGFGCVKGLAPIGWSGGTVSDGTLFVGSKEGRLVAVNLTDNSRLWTEPLKAVSQSGLFGCAPATGGGGCGGRVAGVAIYGTPAVYGGLVYMAGYNGKIYAYNTEGLALRWVYPRESNLKPFVGGLIAHEGKLYIGNSDGKVYALDAVTGDKLWEFQTGDKIWGTPAISGDTLYIGSFDKKLYTIDTSTGKEKWEKPFPTQGAIIATPLVYNGVVYFGSFDRHLYAVDANTGKQIWQFPADEGTNKPKNWFWAEPVVVNDIIYAPCLDGTVYALNTATGVKVTEYDLENPVSSKPVIVDGSVIFATRKGVVYSLAVSTGEIVQLADLEQDIDGPLTVHEGIVYIHTPDLLLQRINAVSGAVLPPVSLASQN